MKLIIGLGNIGSKYIATRHNVGFVVMDALARKFSNSNFQFSKKFESDLTEVEDMLLVKPTTLMNRSGLAVVKLVNFYKVEMDDVYVVHDDLDIKLGEYKIQQGKGPKVHNGVSSVEASLGRDDFWRVRVGVDNRSVEQRATVSGADYVLDRFTKDESEIVKNIVDKVVEDLKLRLL